MVTLYGMDLSNNVTKVRFAANAMGIKYDFKNVNLMAGEQKTPEFRKINPVGRVPAIVEGDFRLFESNAIIKYLADTNNSSLYPKDAKKRATIDQWIDFCSIHVQQALNRVMFNRVIYKFMNAEKDERSLADGLKFLEDFFPIIENQLKENKFLAGNEMTLADINLLAILDPAEIVEVDLAAYPSITRWRNNLKKQDFYTKVHKSAEESWQKAQEAMAAKR